MTSGNMPGYIMTRALAEQRRIQDCLMQMLSDCEHGMIDYVVTKSISRLARNTTDCLEIVRKLLDLGIAVYFEKENIDTGLNG